MRGSKGVAVRLQRSREILRDLRAYYSGVTAGFVVVAVPWVVLLIVEVVTVSCEGHIASSSA